MLQFCRVGHKKFDIIFSLLTFLINTSRYTSATSSTHLLREVRYSKRPHGTLLQRRSTTSVACTQKCHPSSRGSTRSMSRTLCTAFTMAFFTGSKKARDWMSNGSLQSFSLAAFPCKWSAVSHHLPLCRQA